MSINLKLTAHTSTADKEFQKHYNAVKFCIQNELSFPKETSEYFKGKIGGDDLENIREDAIIGYIENGLEFDLPVGSALYTSEEIIVYLNKVPECVEKLVVTIV